MGMYRLEFKANIMTASKNTRDNYYMVGLADDKYHYTNYVLFQRPVVLSADDNCEADANGLYADCNGEVEYNTCRAVCLTNEAFVLETTDSIITVNLQNVELTPRFIEYCKAVFKELLSINLQ